MEQLRRRYEEQIEDLNEEIYELKGAEGGEGEREEGGEGEGEEGVDGEGYMSSIEIITVTTTSILFSYFMCICFS